jgi:uncharacterized ferritin-like protein (DUF455 family)
MDDKKSLRKNVFDGFCPALEPIKRKVVAKNYFDGAEEQNFEFGIKHTGLEWFSTICTRNSLRPLPSFHSLVKPPLWVGPKYAMKDGKRLQSRSTTKPFRSVRPNELFE